MTPHPGLTPEHWQKFSRREQMLMIGTELKRMEHWRTLHDPGTAERSAERATDLLDLTIHGSVSGPQHRELCRAREVLREILKNGDAAGEQLPILLASLIGHA